jgi:septum site-determining protein MinD
MANKIFLTSSKGGTGVTTCAVGLAFALAESGERTLLYDGDKFCSQALGVTGMWGLHVYTLGDAEKGACRVKQTILQHPRSPNFYVMPSLGVNDMEFTLNALSEIEGLFDYVICDKIAEKASDRAIVVTDPYELSLKCADMELARLRDGGIKDVQILINKVNGGLVFDGYILTPQEIATILRAPLAGVIPEDLSLPLGKQKASTTRAFKICADTICGKSKKTLSVIKPYIGVSGLIKRKMRTRL